MASLAAERAQRRVAALFRFILLSLIFAPFAASFGQSALRLLDVVGVSRSPTYIDISIQFTCHVRYINHTPPEDGESVHIRLSLDRDCGNAHSESLPAPAEEGLIRSINLIPLLANDVDVGVTWMHKEAFVIAPTVDLQGLRIRLLRPGREPRATHVLINEPEKDVVSGYAINLDSAQSPFDDAAIAQAQADLQFRAYVSTVTVDGVQWYRLRLGPFAMRSKAEAKLLEAQSHYPRAWLAIADEEQPTTADDTTEVANATPNQDSRGVLPSERIDDKQADLLFASAQTDMRRKNYNGAIESLTKLLRGIPAGQRPQARELLGLARERNGQLAHAKAEYQAYLRDFPNEHGAERVRRRLAALRTAYRSARGSSLFSTDPNDPHAWRLYGGFSQLYRRDNNQINSTNQLSVGVTNTAQNNFASQNALLNDFDMVARRHGTDYDTISRVSAGYIKDLLPNGPGDQVRVSSAYFELTDRERGWSGRFGRQTRSSDGLLGTFDGLFASYQWKPHLTINSAVGFPVETSRSGVNSDRRFEALAFDFGTFGTAWEPSVYLVNQTYLGLTDRQAVGVELHYFQPGRVLVGFVDYDLHFKELNGIVLIGTLALPAQWTINVDVERRKSPLLSTRNALIGQPVQNFGDLTNLFSPQEIEQLAVDRTLDSQIYGISLSRPLGERWQLTLNAASFDTGAMPPSGGVEGIPDQGRENMVSAQLLGLSLFRDNDINAIAVRYQSGGLAKMASIGINSRLPLWGSWRLGPQLRVDRRILSTDNSTQWIYAPALRLDLLHKRISFELEVGTEIASRRSDTISENTRRLYGSAGWRFNF